MSSPELTRDLLMDGGGWKEMKEARKMHRGGLVREATYEDGWLSGIVMTGGKPKKVRMQVISRTHMENKCTCFLARRDGRVCAHAVAVGLEVIEPVGSVAPAEDTPPEREEIEDKWPEVTEESREGALEGHCSVMLPLKVEPSWERGQLMVGFGIESGGEEQLLGALGSGDVLQVGERDASLLRGLKRLFPGEAPGVTTLERARFLQLLEALPGHPRVAFGKKAAAEVSWHPLRPALRLRAGRAVVQWPEGAVPLVDGGIAWALCGTTFRFVAAGVPDRWQGIFRKGATVDAVEARALLARLGPWLEVDEEEWAALPQPAEPVVEVRFEGSLNNLEARMVFCYGSQRRPAGSEGVELLEGADEHVVLTSPDLERLAEDELRQWGFDGPGRRGEFLLRDKNAILQFHAFGLGRLNPEWTLIQGERFAAFAKDIVPIEPVFEVRGSGEDWFAMEVDYRTTAGEEVPRQEIQRLLQMGQGDRPAKGGKLAVLDASLVDEVAQTLTDCDPHQESPGVFRIDARQAAYLRQAAGDLGIALTGKEAPGGEGTDDGWQERLGDLAEVLRPYQREGVAWLWRLSELGMGGVLADDMGLGKTLQTLAFLKVRGGRALVVCPSSLVHNWLAEAERFVPELEAVAITGPERAKSLAAAGKADLLVTTYALLRLDVDLYRSEEFATVILDEAQQIKNPEAQVSKAAFGLKARHKFALTGTPIENSVKDLWSITNFAMPGYLGDRSRFAERFEKPLAKGADEGLQRRLARRLKPVVKRRLKKEVAADLPDKIEQVRFCDLNGAQRKVYEAILVEGRTQLESADGGKKRMLALTTLLRLRQACCDLRLLDLPGVDEKDASVKMTELEGLLLEAAEGGHRVLVFSQFVELLKGVVPMLAEHGMPFCYLDGSTRNRGEVVARFQEDASIPVFLISLKAGGVGLNLTGADTVIHLDPWWNPAVEAQATDRAHRIGQERVVTSYKLIARDTVEEKILALQDRKRALVESTLDADLPTGGSSLSEDEIFGLFG